MNTIFIILLFLILILVILKLLGYYYSFMEEGFQEQVITPQFMNNYYKFITFYNQFLLNWEKTIISSIASDTPQAPLSSPSQISTGVPPSPTRLEINAYISSLSTKLRTPFPQITDSLPSNITLNNLNGLMSIIPTDTEPYKNAFMLMNSYLEKAQNDLKESLAGAEGFEDKCQSISECVLNNPQLLAKLFESQTKQDAMQIQKKQEELNKRMNTFLSDKVLIALNQKNQELVKQADKIRQQAESGELLNKINIKDDTTKYIMPEGGNKLSELKKNNPAKYKELQSSNKQLFDLKQLFEQINANL